MTDSAVGRGHQLLAVEEHEPQKWVTTRYDNQQQMSGNPVW